jgi:CRISPR/Cas system CSM-associated protein Csm4 (group 5 of RAMP superfamily)
MFGLRDVFRTNVKKEEFLFEDAFKEFLTRLKEEKSICLSMLANACSTMTIISTLQYGILALNEQYSTEKSA